MGINVNSHLVNSTYFQGFTWEEDVMTTTGKSEDGRIVVVLKAAGKII